MKQAMYQGAAETGPERALMGGRRGRGLGRPGDAGGGGAPGGGAAQRYAEERGAPAGAAGRPGPASPAR